MVVMVVVVLLIVDLMHHVGCDGCFVDKDLNGFHKM